MKKIFLITITACLFLAACNNGSETSTGGGDIPKDEEKEEVTGVTVPGTFSLVHGSTATLTATVEPADAPNKNVSWTSNNKSVATIDDNGLVTAVSVGQATITATTEVGDHQATCEVTVSARVKVKGIELLDVYFVDTKTPISIEAKVLPENATDPTYRWESGDETIVKFSAEGMLSGLKEGSTTITAISNDGDLEATATITVNALGQTIFQTPTLWTIGNQVWSDAVKAQGNTAGKYTWPVVNEFKDQLCANGWRVPTKRDFCELDKTLNMRDTCDDRDDDVAIGMYNDMFIPGLIAGTVEYFLWSQDICDDYNVLLDYFGNPEIFENYEFGYGLFLEPYHYYMVQPEKIVNQDGELPVRCVKDVI
jgi:hypothetical protein